MTSEKRIALFWSKVNKTAGCWLWDGAKNSKGYGRFSFVSGGRRLAAHRIAYVLSGRALNDAQTLDHLCRNHACVNPAHLELVTNRENILRGIGFAAKNAAKTHCKNGHPYTAANTMIQIRHSHVSRKCRECERARTRAWHQANAERENAKRAARYAASKLRSLGEDA